jgi:hypothetical protein
MSFRLPSVSVNMLRLVIKIHRPITIIIMNKNNVNQTFNNRIVNRWQTHTLLRRNKQQTHTLLRRNKQIYKKDL